MQRINLSVLSQWLLGFLWLFIHSQQPPTTTHPPCLFLFWELFTTSLESISLSWIENCGNQSRCINFFFFFHIHTNTGKAIAAHVCHFYDYYLSTVNYRRQCIFTIFNWVKCYHNCVVEYTKKKSLFVCLSCCSSSASFFSVIDVFIVRLYYMMW